MMRLSAAASPSTAAMLAFGDFRRGRKQMDTAWRGEGTVPQGQTGDAASR